MPITVEVTVNASGTAPSVTASPDPVRIPANVRGTIQWKITNPAPEGWKFQAVGIDIQNPGGEFDQPHGGGSRIFTWNNKHTRSATFKYSVKVTNGAANVELDPTMINE
jgi:hypothetical protein